MPPLHLGGVPGAGVVWGAGLGAASGGQACSRLKGCVALLLLLSKGSPE